MSHQNSPGKIKGKLVKVADNPPTWLEFPKDMSQEEINTRVERFKKNHVTLDGMVKRGDFKNIFRGSENYKQRCTYSGPIYHIPSKSNGELL